MNTATGGRNAGPENGVPGPPGKTRPINCPNCGRRLQIPVSAQARTLVCKGCLHVLKYSRDNGEVRSVGVYQPPQAAGNEAREHIHISRSSLIRYCSIIMSLLLLAGIAWFLWQQKHAARLLPEDAAPRATLEEVRDALKGLAE